MTDTSATHLVRITKYSHYIKVDQYIPRVEELLWKFVRKFMKVDYTRSNRVTGAVGITTTFAWANRRDQFRFHINTYDRFIEFLQIHEVYERNILEVEAPFYDALDADIKMQPGYEPRDSQPKMLDYIFEDNGNRAKFIGLATGSGKTVVSMMAAARYQKRLVILIPPKFIGKWVQDCKQLTQCEDDEILVIEKGTKRLINFLQLTEMDHPAAKKIKIIIFSNKLWQNWIKTYQSFGEDTRDLGYTCMPHEFFQYVQAGMRLIDEVHMDFHLNFKTDLFTHVPLSVSLSATLLNLDAFTENMYRLAYPLHLRADIPPPKKYTVAYGVIYNLKENRHYKTTERGQSTYSHTAYEKSILKQPEFKQNYFKMIKDVIDSSFTLNYQPGDKIGVYAASRELCTQLTDYLSFHYPQWTVKRFVEGDDYQENFKKPDVRVTTVLSGGTAHDVAGLTNVVMTNAIQSIQANIQIFGRLRELKDGRTTHFHFLTCGDIEKHVKYHKEKVELFDKRAKAYKTTFYNHRI